MKEKEKKIIHNNFFDLIAFLLSFLLSFFRSILIFFSSHKIKARNYFFDFFDFSFRIWGKYFWENPTWYKIGSFF
jgi:hypothetical protein